MHSLWFVQWDFTRQDHPGNPGGVSGSGPVIESYAWVPKPWSFIKLHEVGNFLTLVISSIKGHLIAWGFL